MGLALDALSALNDADFLGYGALFAIVGIPLAAILAPRVVAAARPWGFVLAAGAGGPAIVLLYVALSFGISPQLLVLLMFMIATMPVSLLTAGAAIFLTRLLAPWGASLWPATAALTLLAVGLYGYALL